MSIGKDKKIAIVGAGFAGLALAWNFLQKGCAVHLYDSRGIGNGASGIAAGLLHPYSGLHAKLNWMGEEGYLATQELLKVADKTLQGGKCWGKSGLLRLAITEENKKDFSQAAKLHPDITWLTKDESLKKIPCIDPYEGIFINECITVDSPLYLQALWKTCENQGAYFFKQEMERKSLDSYDVIIFATGAHAEGVNPVKGQILELEWPKHLSPLSSPLNSQVYILMSKDNQSCLVGATYEKKYSTAASCLNVASEQLLPKAVLLIPALKDAKILACKAGLRASTPSHKPLIKAMDAKSWVFTGLGSKGLLYHAFFAKNLVNEISSSF
jgi:glycine/D-amino acid oxidase-like deaminating enzyme